MSELNLPVLSLATQSIEDKWNVLELILWVDCAFGSLFFLSSLTVSDLWGSGAYFQLSTTCVIFMAFSVYMLGRVRNQSVNPSHADFLGAFGLALSIILLQTSLLWHDFGNGLGFTRVQKEGEELFGHEQFPKGGAERSCSRFAFICFLLNSGLCYLIYVWRSDLFSTGPVPFWTPSEDRVGEIQKPTTSSRKKGSEGGKQSFNEKFGFINPKNNNLQSEQDEEDDDFAHYQRDELNMAESVF